MVRLLVSRTKARRALRVQIKQGEALKVSATDYSVTVNDLVDSVRLWHQYNEQMLESLFSDRDFRNEYRGASGLTGSTGVYARANSDRFSFNDTKMIAQS